MTKRCIRTLRCVLLSPFNGWKKQKPKAEKDSVILLKSPQQAKGGGGRIPTCLPGSKVQGLATALTDLLLSEEDWVR